MCDEASQGGGLSYCVPLIALPLPSPRLTSKWLDRYVVERPTEHMTRRGTMRAAVALIPVACRMERFYPELWGRLTHCARVLGGPR